MTLLELLAVIETDDSELQSGQPVTIPIADFKTKNGFAIGFTTGNVNVTLPNGTLIATPLQNDQVTLPVLGTLDISGGEQSIVLQKPPAG
jgi:hypothetical protein